MTAEDAFAGPGDARARPCPACTEVQADAVEDVVLHEQHLRMAGGDIALARRLDGYLAPEVQTYRVLRCRRCELEFAAPLSATPGPWYTALYAHLDLYPGRRWEYDFVAAALSRDAAIVDYGCGNGHFLASVSEQVRHAIGFDFSAASVEQAIRRGIDARVLDLEGEVGEVALPHPADHVVAFHVLEHLADPSALYRFATQVASAKARLWVAVPSDRRASRAYHEADLMDSPPHHLTRWTPEALRLVGHRNGWALQQHTYEPLPTHLRIWEATRRLDSYRRINPGNRALTWLMRRALAAGVWASGRHRAANASGFSMLACYSREQVP